MIKIIDREKILNSVKLKNFLLKYLILTNLK